MRYKSVEGIGCAWNADGLLVKNPVTRTTITTEPVTVALLHHFREWNTVAQAAKEVGYDEESVTEAVGSLHSLGFLNSEDAPDGDTSSSLGPWRPWSHEGTAFHFMTRDAPFVETTDQIREELTTELPPPLFKDYPDADRVFLPRNQTRLDAPYGEVLYGRRTHRDFSAEPVDRETFSTLMGAVFGLKDFIDAKQFGSLMLRTSPSGGSRHELEAYVAVSDVADVSPGIYHYGRPGARAGTHPGGGLPRRVDPHVQLPVRCRPSGVLHHPDLGRGAHEQQVPAPQGLPGHADERRPPRTDLRTDRYRARPGAVPHRRVQRLRRGRPHRRGRGLRDRALRALRRNPQNRRAGQDRLRQPPDEPRLLQGDPIRHQP